MHVLGYSPEQLRVVARLLTVHADVVVHADEVAPTIEDLADREYVQWTTEPFLGSAQAHYIALTPQAAPACGHDRSADLRAVGELLRYVPPFPDLRVAPGSVWLVGAGPGRAELVTVGCQKVVAQADVLVTDRLVPMSVLASTRDDTLIVDVAKIPRGRFTAQEAINQTLIRQAQAGKKVVRLKGGDPYLFGRGMEEFLACHAAGVPVQELPGVPSALAVPAAAQVPATHRGVAQSVTIVSGHVPPDHPASTTDWAAVARIGGTIVVLMGVANFPAIAQTLVAAGLPAQTPCATITDQGLGPVASHQWTLADVASVGSIPVRPPAIVVIGQVTDVFMAATGVD